MAEIFGGILIVFGVLALVFMLERQGRKAEQNDEKEQVLDDLQMAKRARDRLRDDPAVAKRVRDRFTR